MPSNLTILVIDDSTTIRRLVDTTLSREGYSVILAPTAEEGIAFAREHDPDMILLDHQLPGTTGFEVCQTLTAEPDLQHIPVVVSSTLRKKAYVEYADLANVVDMLPKPYTEDLLLTTVSNAIDTGKLIVQSQAQGTAVPEVIDEQRECDLSGTFSGSSVREILDFLNNGRKSGTLEVDATHKRYSIYLADGRVVGIAATGVATTDVTERLPDSLSELVPVLNVTMGRGGAALESIVDLLNTEVLDPRLLRKLLRHQAAVLLMHCFSDSLKSFRFIRQSTPPALFQRLPLDVSVLALLVEGALTRTQSELPSANEATKFTRQPIRGQNLDRAGLSARQSSILSQLTKTRTLSELISATDTESHEARAVLYGLELADLVEREEGTLSNAPHRIIVFESDVEIANKINATFADSESYDVTVVNDAMAAGLFAKRSAPEVMVVDVTSSGTWDQLQGSVDSSETKWIATSEVAFEADSVDLVLARPFTAADLLAALDAVSGGKVAEAHGIRRNSSEASLEGNLCTT